MWEVHGTKMKDVGNYDVAIVLSGMAEYNNDLGEISIRRTGDRIFQAITLYKTGKVKKLMISGDSGYITDRGLHEAAQLKELLVKWGIPATDIITEEVSRNTHENAAESKKILERSYPHLKKILLVTSGMHMRRSLACFKKEGLECDTFSTDLYSSPKGGYFWDQYIIPDVGTFATWTKLLKEIVGYVTYDIAGYI